MLRVPSASALGNDHSDDAAAVLAELVAAVVVDDVVAAEDVDDDALDDPDVAGADCALVDVPADGVDLDVLLPPHAATATHSAIDTLTTITVRPDRTHRMLSSSALPQTPVCAKNT